MREDWAVWKAQFRVLYRVFFLRVIDLELLASDGDPSRLMGQFASIFASISFFLTLPALLVLAGGGPLPADVAWTFEHFFIETTMTLGGLITVLNWESAFPDRLDVLVLAPLPVRTSILFLAKVAALFAGPFLTIICFNIFCGFAWSFIFGLSSTKGLGTLRALPAYWATVFLAGAFILFSVLTLQGLAANLLPRQLFLRLSALLQAATLCLLLVVYFLEPSFRTPAAFIAPGSQSALAWLPSYWFLGLFHQLNGSMHPALAPLARRAWTGLAVSGLGATSALLLSYFRMLPKTVEQPDILPGARSARWRPRLGASLRDAITLFSLRTLLRSRQHRTILSLYVGVGLAIVLGYVNTRFVGVAPVKDGISITFLLASILTMILTVLAIRVVASIPISLRANWMVRVTQVRPARMHLRAVRVSWLILGVAPVLLVLAVPLLAFYPWRPVVGHLATMLALGMLVVEICLFTFPKISFTCSYMPGKANIHFVFWVFLLFFIRWLKDCAIFESGMLRDWRDTLLMILVLGLLAGGVRWFAHASREDSDELLFEEEDFAKLISLKLD